MTTETKIQRITPGTTKRRMERIKNKENPRLQRKNLNALAISILREISQGGRGDPEEMAKIFIEGYDTIAEEPTPEKV